MARYLLLIVWPMRLSADYSYAQIPLASGQLWIGWRGRRLRPSLQDAFCSGGANSDDVLLGGFALLTFLPASQLLFPTGTIMAERVMYLPSLGVIALS
jgi:hypothetical protein